MYLFTPQKENLSTLWAMQGLTPLNLREYICGHSYQTKFQKGTEKTDELTSTKKITIMGILIKKSIDNVQVKNVNDYYHMVNKPPFVKAKLVKLSADKVEDFKARQLQYYIGQVPGFNIFFIHAGFNEVPDHIISDREIKSSIDELCRWYLTEKAMKNESSIRNYKIKKNHEK